MTERKLQLTRQQLAQAQHSFDSAALNGIMALAVILKKRGLISEDEIELMHETMVKPLDSRQNATNPLAQATQEHIDRLFAGLARQAK